jgi:hypothetical protein
MHVPSWLVSAAFQLYRFLPRRWTAWLIKVHFGQPRQGASANTDPLLSWWHVPVSLGSRPELTDCRILLTLNTHIEERNMVWSSNQGPTETSTLRFGDPGGMVPIAIRSEADISSSAHPGHLPHFSLPRGITRLTDAQALFHQANFLDLSPGEYEIRLILRWGNFVRSSPPYRLNVPPPAASNRNFLLSRPD